MSKGKIYKVEIVNWNKKKEGAMTKKKNNEFFEILFGVFFGIVGISGVITALSLERAKMLEIGNLILLCISAILIGISISLLKMISEK